MMDIQEFFLWCPVCKDITDFTCIAMQDDISCECKECGTLRFFEDWDETRANAEE